MIVTLLCNADMRKPYNNQSETFTESDLVAKEPIQQFKVWFDEACRTNGILEANAMCLATASKYIVFYVYIIFHNDSYYLFILFHYALSGL